jgi:ribonuclease G
VKKIIINAEQWQTRVAIVQDNELKNIYFEPHSHDALERSFFKGKINKVLPGIQTAFVEIGQQRAGFLHISEIDRELALDRISKTAQWEDDEPKEKVNQGRNSPPDIGKILTEGEHILVQVAKEPVYEKGAKLTTCFTLPGRFFVLMPNIPRIGISKKIENREDRLKLKAEIKALLPEGMGVIIRTSALGASEKEINKDLEYLLSEWREIEKRYETATTETKIYQDIDLVLQIVRDHLDNSIEAIIVDNKDVQSSIYKFVKAFASEYSHVIQLYSSATTPLFKKFNIEKQIQTALERKVALKSGGSLIIESTEAMTVIDVNTGKFIGKSNLEETIFKTNMEAAQEIPRQICLRNIGGLIVIDMIDMKTQSNRQKLFKFFEKALKEQDKFQSVVLKISEFGLVQMTRKRSGKTLLQQLMHQCPSCHSLGFVKSIESQAYELLRQLKEELSILGQKQVMVFLHPDLFKRISTIEYNGVLALEKSFSGKIILASDTAIDISDYKIVPVTS